MWQFSLICHLGLPQVIFIHYKSRIATAIRGLYILDEDDNGKFRFERAKWENSNCEWKCKLVNFPANYILTTASLVDLHPSRLIGQGRHFDQSDDKGLGDLPDHQTPRRWHNVGLMLCESRRRWANIKPTIHQCLVFTEREFLSSKHERSKQCWFNVGPPSATLAQQ